MLRGGDFKLALNNHILVVKLKRLAWFPSAIVITLFSVMLFGFPASSQTRDLDTALEALGARHAELEREESAFRASTAPNGSAVSEREEHAEFVAGLRRKFWEQCETVRGLGGDASVAKFPCVKLAATESSPSLRPAVAVQTDEEKRAAIRARLNALEDAIDEDLLKRQQELRQAAATPSGGGGGGAAGGGGQEGQSGAGRETAGGTAGQRGGAEGSNAGPGGAVVPPATPSNAGQHERAGVTDGGAGDDIVARQLRQAAEAESDPVLKEKLWAEYRRYRGGRG
ncbi:MAG: hypothetical protein ACK5XB_17935 [Rhodospirillales bacterium]